MNVLRVTRDLRFIHSASCSRSLAIRFRTSLISADSSRDVPQQRFGRVFALNPGMKKDEGKGGGTRRQAGKREGWWEEGIMQNNGGIVRMA